MHDELAVLQVVDDGHSLKLEDEADEVEAVRLMVEKDLPMRVICDRLRITEQRYRQILKNNKITRPPKWSWVRYAREKGIRT